MQTLQSILVITCGRFLIVSVAIVGLAISAHSIHRGLEPTQAQEDRCATSVGCNAVFIEDFGDSSYPRSADIRWEQAPTDAELASDTRYFLRFVTDSGGDASPSVEVGMIGAPGRPFVIYSLCHLCNERPDAPSTLANHGPIQQPTSIQVNYDRDTGTWAWYINNNSVRSVNIPAVGPPRRMVTGVLSTSEHSRIGRFWHNHVRIWMSNGPYSLFSSGAPTYIPGHAAELLDIQSMRDGSILVQDVEGRS
ncbi:MAG: hypothetical protein KDH92_08550 [Chloroflexi bacterium]|nr:hypothetical protein [Chloroflexota bacterium]